MVNDPPQYITHYFHFVAGEYIQRFIAVPKFCCVELLFGLWRTYSSLDPTISKAGHTKLPPPKRMLFTRTPSKKWRDYANLNQLVLRAIYPSLTMEFEEDWVQRASAPGKALVFDRVVLGDRGASMQGEQFAMTNRPAGEPFLLPGSPHWWAPIRNSMVRFVGQTQEPGKVSGSKPTVITYVSRQEWGRRMLKPADHERLGM